GGGRKKDEGDEEGEAEGRRPASRTKTQVHIQGDVGRCPGWQWPMARATRVRFLGLGLSRAFTPRAFTLLTHFHNVPGPGETASVSVRKRVRERVICVFVRVGSSSTFHRGRETTRISAYATTNGGHVVKRLHF
ncbi:hypothetical protein X777_08226, partial [Ooceraea biroi]